VIRFRLDARSGLPVYRQLMEQVRQAIQLEVLRPGDQLPTVRQAVGQVAINPNTVHRAYRELEQEGLVVGRQGQGTFVVGTVRAVEPARREELSGEMDRWVRSARLAGLDGEGMRAVLAAAVRKIEAEGEERP